MHCLRAFPFRGLLATASFVQLAEWMGGVCFWDVYGRLKPAGRSGEAVHFMNEGDIESWIKTTVSGLSFVSHVAREDIRHPAQLHCFPRQLLPTSGCMCSNPHTCVLLRFWHWATVCCFQFVAETLNPKLPAKRARSIYERTRPRLRCQSPSRWGDTCSCSVCWKIPHALVLSERRVVSSVWPRNAVTERSQSHCVTSQ